MTANAPKKLYLNHKDFIAYHRLESAGGDENHVNSRRPTVVFLGGFMSDMQGTKALALADFCKEKNYGYIRFDYLGHGQSSRKFTEGTIGIWRDNCLKVIDELTQGRLILIGSSMGGWLMLLAALARPERVAGLIGIASAPDFTEELIWDVFSAPQKTQLLTEGMLDLSSEYSEAPYPITKDLIEDGRNHLLLQQKSITINKPIVLIHGQKDDDVPCSVSERLHEKLTSKHKKLCLVAEGDHRMSTDSNIKLLFEVLDKMMQDID